MAVRSRPETSHASRGGYDMLGEAVEKRHVDEMITLGFVRRLRERTVQHPSRLGSA
jgi:hypothetical protein